MVDYRITAAERTRFKRCRRQWDFASPHRRNLRSSGVVEPALPAALKDALAVYYYPGTWDWQHEVTQPLVHKALERSLGDAGATESLNQGRRSWTAMTPGRMRSTTSRRSRSTSMSRRWSRIPTTSSADCWCTTDHR